ncbi:hypothetical protein C9413_07830 [Rhizobium sp. SEMIA 4085]|uniref:Uncharacterized protein n=1 Tax=Rhizobium gallicum bv. gallicum R602sp TaxID=1041138 RepID=A0A0B4X996_9HYPH|nr:MULTISPECIES: hypothetical protein [Rhizobium]AJD43711.1 hypothetical protein RGR602_PB00173 [Rhizobium gallicum bv. gallicum R602sp]NNH29412.1 hypothetical protein [Rhizobium sp. SEMIA 4085]TDW34193.1 hypothetical protein EV128_104200 [Rhizobium azibense]
MRSPWKFLAQLTSQRRPAETRESSIGREADTEASESEAQQSSALPLNPTEASHGSEHNENRSAQLMAITTSNETEREVDAARAVSVPVDVEEVRAPARHEVSQSSAEAQAVRLESETSKKSPPPRTKRPRTDMVAQSTAVANRDKSAQFSSSREAFFDEVAGLDEEIKQLRIQFAQKLHLQNIQLKKMLARFDVS